MPQINITPDQIVFLRWGHFTLSATIVFAWVVMALLVALALNGCSEDRAATTASTTTRTAQAADCSDDLVACARKSTLADAVPDKAGGE